MSYVFLCYNVKHMLLKCRPNLMFQVELSKFVADHDFCLEIMYEEQHQPHVIIEKADTSKGSLVYFIQYLNNYTSNIVHLNVVVIFGV